MAFPFYGADGTSGTVAVSNGSKDVVGTGTNWLSNNAVPTAGGYAIKMPDGQIYGIDACTGEGALHLVENYNGTTISGGSYYIMPVAAAIGKLLNDVSALLNSSNFSQLAGLSPNNGDYVQYVSGTWATRTALQSLLNLLNSMSEVNIASASTCDIGAATSPKVQITGTTTITGLGSLANAVRFVRFGGALTLTHNASTLILLGGQSRNTASGDWGFYASDSSGNWREVFYSRAVGVIGFIANRNGINQTGMTGGAAAKVALNNIIRNDGGYYDGVTNYRFTPPPGVYRVTVSIGSLAGTSNETGQAYIEKSGTIVAESIYFNGGALSASVNTISIVTADIPCDGTEYLEAFAYVPTGATAIQGGATKTFFSAYKIRDL